eukprot:2755495-Rhodomonas_salina.1
MHGRKSWLIYSARTNHFYSSTSATFDETLFPAKHINQRIFSYYDTASVSQFHADMHAAKLNSTLAGDLPNLLATTEKLWTANDVCHDHLECGQYQNI